MPTPNPVEAWERLGIALLPIAEEIAVGAEPPNYPPGILTYEQWVNAWADHLGVDRVPRDLLVECGLVAGDPASMLDIGAMELI